MLNRTALIVRPAAPYIEWARSLDDSGLVPNPEDEKTVYLIPDLDSQKNAETLLRKVYAEVFERELFAWHTAEEDWPKSRTFAMFKKWFNIELHSVVEDLCSYPVSDDEDDA